MNIGKPLRTVTYPLPEKVEQPQPIKVEPEEKPILVPNWPVKQPVKEPVPERV